MFAPVTDMYLVRDPYYRQLAEKVRCRAEDLEQSSENIWRIPQELLPKKPIRLFLQRFYKEDIDKVCLGPQFDDTMLTM